MEKPFGFSDAVASDSIKKELKEKINLEKKFYDINFVEEGEKV